MEQQAFISFHTDHPLQLMAMMANASSQPWRCLSEPGIVSLGRGINFCIGSLCIGLGCCSQCKHSRASRSFDRPTVEEKWKKGSQAEDCHMLRIYGTGLGLPYDVGFQHPWLCRHFKHVVVFMVESCICNRQGSSDKEDMLSGDSYK